MQQNPSSPFRFLILTTILTSVASTGCNAASPNQPPQLIKLTTSQEKGRTVVDLKMTDDKTAPENLFVRLAYSDAEHPRDEWQKWFGGNISKEGTRFILPSKPEVTPAFFWVDIIDEQGAVVTKGPLPVSWEKKVPASSFKDYFVGTVKVKVHEAELSEDRKRVPWTGYGVDGGFPGTVVTAVEITNASGTYSLPEDMVDDLGNPNGHGHVRLIGSPTAIRAEALLELSMTNGDGAGGHNVLFQVDLEKAQARRFVKVAIDDNHTKTHDWTTIKNHKETKRKAPAKDKGAKKVDDRVRDPRMEKCMAILLKNQPHPDRYPPKVKDISKVEGLTAWDINNEELALIAPYLSHLKWLHFYRMSVGGPSVSDVSPLKVMKNLEKLIFDGTCEKVTDFSVLRNLKNLKHLNLEGTQFSDVSSLESLTKLEILNLCDTPVKDLSALKNLKKLTKLNLDGTQVSDVSVLENLKNLKTLDLEGTQVKDLSALKNLKDLTELRLVETPVRNLSPLHGLKLKSLDVELNKFSVKELEMDAKFLSKIKDLYAGSGDYDVKLLRFFVKHRIGNEFRVAYKKIPVEVILDKQVRTIESRKELEGLGLDETVLSGVDLKSNLILTEQKDLNDPNGTRLLGINYSVTNRSFSVGVMTTCIGFRDAGRWTTKFYSVKRVE